MKYELDIDSYDAYTTELLTSFCDSLSCPPNNAIRLLLEFTAQNQKMFCDWLESNCMPIDQVSKEDLK